MNLKNVSQEHSHHIFLSTIKIWHCELFWFSEFNEISLRFVHRKLLFRLIVLLQNKGPTGGGEY